MRAGEGLHGPTLRFPARLGDFHRLSVRRMADHLQGTPVIDGVPMYREGYEKLMAEATAAWRASR